MPNYEFTYGGSYSTLEPNYGEFLGYRVPASEVGFPLNPQTANQIQELSNALNQGAKIQEVGALSPEVFEQIPKQHFKEMAQLQKLTGAETSVHAPILEPSGFTKEGWSEQNREAVERQLKEVVEKSHQLNPKGNIPVTVHSTANLPGTEWVKIKDPETGETKEVQQKIIAINQETKQLIPLEREEKFYPEYGAEKKIYTPEEELGMANRSDWVNSVTNIAFYNRQGAENLQDAYAEVAPLIIKENAGEKIDYQKLTPQQKQSLNELEKGEIFLDNAETSFRSLFNKAYKYGRGKTQEFLKQTIAKPWQEDVEELRKKIEASKGRITPLQQADMIYKKSLLINDTINKLKAIGEHKQLPAPQLYKPIDEFALEQSSQTIGNVAFDAYKKHGDKAPIVSVENLFPGMAFSRSKEMKALIKQSRKQFVEQAKEEGMSESQAESASKKLIGVTWDVGHLNMLRKQGFKKEDIEKETQEIAKYVKHLHLTDNFGFSDSHLPPGMGNVPTKEILEQLEKEGFKGKKIVEAGGFVQHFKTSPHPYVLSAFGSPIYSMQMAPFWNQAYNTMGSYYSGYGPFLPEQHFSIYGAGFSGLPQELGGQIPGKQSRMSGTPMA